MSTPETGAIHDIGYRRYDGERLGPTYLFNSLVVHSLRGAFGLGRSTKSKVMPLLLLTLMVAPALVIAAIAALTAGTSLPVRYSSYAVNLQIVVSVFVAAQAPQLVSLDLRYRVVTLYLSRPLGSAAYLRAKLVAMSAAVFLLLAAPLLVLYAGALLAELAFWENTREAAAALVGAAVFAVVLAAISLTIAAFTPRRGLGVAAVVAVLLVSGGIAGTVAGIAQSQGREDLAGWAGLLSPYSLVDGVAVWALGAETSVVTGPPGGAAGAVFLLVTVAVVAACYGLLLARYRRVSVS